MWSRLVKGRKDFEFAATRTRRRGMRLTVMVALMMAMPGIVAGTSFVSVASTTLTSTGNQVGIASVDCGFNIGTSNDATYVTIAGTQDTGNHLYISSVVVTTNVLQGTSTSGYEYEQGEVYFGCWTTPSTASIKAAFSVSGLGISGVTSTSADWAAVQMTSDSGSTTSYEGAAANWCDPTVKTISAGACSGTAPTACTYTGSAFTPALYSPENTQLGAYASTNTWMWVNGVVAGAQVGAAGQCGGSAFPGAVTIQTGKTATMYYYEDFSFAFGDMPATITNSAWTITATITVT